jgi:hypothetical protein
MKEKVNLQSQVKYGIQRMKLATAQWKNALFIQGMWNLVVESHLLP